MTEIKEQRCHDCNAREGEIHKLGCDMERCPFCGNQLISCACRYTKLGMKYDWEEPYSGLPPEIYKNGLTDDLQEKWEKILENKGRIPYIVYPNICARCGTKWPTGEMYPDWVWRRYVPIAKRDKILCSNCFREIKGLIDERANLRPIKWVECPFCTGEDQCHECQSSGKMDHHAVAGHLKRKQEHENMLKRLSLNIEKSE